MHSELVDLLLFSLLMIMLALFGLLLMVQRELGPLARLAGHRRWLLAAALGSGILAFALKLMIIVAVAWFPAYVVEPLLEPLSPHPHQAAPPLASTPPHYLWLALPQESAAEPIAPSTSGYSWESLPDRAPAPADNPTTPNKIALGKRLFFDTALSRDGTLSCASCHDVAGRAGSDGSATSLGIEGKHGTRNAPTVWNAAFQDRLFWDGRAASLEEQAKGPLINPLEMGMPSWQAVEDRLRKKGEYRVAFNEAFGDGPISIERIAQAIAAYERPLITTDTPYDRFVRGDRTALTPQQLHGMNLFQSVGCINCHFGPNFSAASLFDTTQPLRPFPLSPLPEQERYRLSDDTGAATGLKGHGVWRVPSLRNVALTGPWFHNGEVSDLAEAVRIMSAAQLGYSGHLLVWSDRDKRLHERRQRKLKETEVADLVAFLNALSSDTLRRAIETGKARGG